MSDEDASFAALHAGKRRGLIIVGGNLVLLIMMLGVPWLRGYLRTRELLRAFAAYGACLYDGEPAQEPGLGMPSGHEARLATRVLRVPGFAARCDGALEQLAPRAVIFILPGLKVAEADLRAAVALLRQQLAPLSARVPGAPLPIKPLQAIERLRAGLANHTTAAGMRVAPPEQAFRLSDADTLPTPTRVPVATGPGAAISLWGSDDELRALALDKAGISYAQLRAGKLEQTRVPRPKLLEGATPIGLPRDFVWAMPRARCDTRAGGCAEKALGIAGIRLPVSAPPVPRWLGGHPRGRVDRSIWRSDARIAVVAERSDGGSELREFTLAPEAELGVTADMPPLEATRVWPTSVRGEPLLLSQAGEPRVLFVSKAEQTVSLHELTPHGVTRLESVPGQGAPWLVGCRDDAALHLVFGHDEALVLASLRDDVLTRSELVTLPLRDVVDAHDAARDRVVPVCGGGSRMIAIVHDRRDRLWRLSCSESGGKCALEPIGARVRSFAARAQAGRLVVAYAGDATQSQIRVRSSLLHAPAGDDEQVPAACWSDARGMCGPPLLSEAGGRLVLAALEGGDLRVLESADAGQSWRALEGLSRYH